MDSIEDILTKVNCCARTDFVKFPFFSFLFFFYLALNRRRLSTSCLVHNRIGELFSERTRSRKAIKKADLIPLTFVLSALKVCYIPSLTLGIRKKSDNGADFSRVVSFTRGFTPHT